MPTRVSVYISYDNVQNMAVQNSIHILNVRSFGTYVRTASPG